MTSGSAQQQPTQTQSALHLWLSLYVQCSALQCTSVVALGEDEHPRRKTCAQHKSRSRSRGFPARRGRPPEFCAARTGRLRCVGRSSRYISACSYRSRSFPFEFLSSCRTLATSLACPQSRVLCKSHICTLYVLSKIGISHGYFCAFFKQNPRKCAFCTCILLKQTL